MENFIFCAVYGKALERFQKVRIKKVADLHPFRKNDRYTETAARGVLQKKVCLEISHNSQENTCPRYYFLIKLQA